VRAGAFYKRRDKIEMEIYTNKQMKIILAFHDLKIKDLAGRIGVAQSRLSDWANRKRPITEAGEKAFEQIKQDYVLPFVSLKTFISFI